LKKSEISRQIVLTLIITLFFLSGCAHYTINQPAKQVNQNDAYEFNNFTQPEDGEETFVILTFSGGGTRAAAFSYGVMEKLRTIHLHSKDKTILDDVDVISTVSGGSFTGAYYALFGDRIFEDYKAKFLYRNIEKELAYKLLNPVNWARLASPYYSRIDLASELYDETVFESLTFKALADKVRRPFLIINATNLYNGARFEFTGEQFNYIGSDILSYPVARAVAASSAFPFLLAPVSLVNYPFPPGYEESEADKMALQDYWVNKERYFRTANNLMFSDKTTHPYVHLMDGGLADNIGLRAIQDLYVRGGIRKKINDGKIKYLLVIVVNAKNAPPQKFDQNESPPGLATVGLKTCTISMDNYSFETIESIKQIFEERIKAQQYIESCQEHLDKHCRDSYELPSMSGGQMKLYVVDISFDNVSDKDEREFLKNLPTTFYLEKVEVDRLIEAGGRLLVEHPEFKAFLEEYR